MFRDVPAYRHLVEICHSGLEEEKSVVDRLVTAHQDRCLAEGVRIEAVQRGVVPGQVMITVGGGAEGRALDIVDWMELNGAPGRVDVYLHPHCLPRPMFFLLPAESAEARRHLRWILSVTGDARAVRLESRPAEGGQTRSGASFFPRSAP